MKTYQLKPFTAAPKATVIERMPSLLRRLGVLEKLHPESWRARADLPRRGPRKVRCMSRHPSGGRERRGGEYGPAVFTVFAYFDLVVRSLFAFVGECECAVMLERVLGKLGVGDAMTRVAACRNGIFDTGACFLLGLAAAGNARLSGGIKR